MFKSIASMMIVALLALTQANTCETVNLHVEKGPGLDDVQLNWTGGTGICKIYRSTNPTDVRNSHNLIGQSVNHSFTDTVFAEDLYFYQVVSQDEDDQGENNNNQ